MALKELVGISDHKYVHNFNDAHWKSLSHTGFTLYMRHWTMASRDVSNRQTVEVRSRSHCAVLCEWELRCRGFDTDNVNSTVSCHMAMGAVDASPVDGD